MFGYSCTIYTELTRTKSLIQYSAVLSFPTILGRIFLRRHPPWNTVFVRPVGFEPTPYYYFGQVPKTCESANSSTGAFQNQSQVPLLLPYLLGLSGTLHLHRSAWSRDFRDTLPLWQQFTPFTGTVAEQPCSQGGYL